MAYLGGIIGKIELEETGTYTAENNNYYAVAKVHALDSEDSNNPVLYIPGEHMIKLIQSQHENTITAEMGIGTSIEGVASDSPCYMDDNAYAGGIVEHMYSGAVKNCLIEGASITVKPYYTFTDAIGYVGGIVARLDGGSVEGCVVDEDSVIIGVPHDVTNFLPSSGRPHIKAGGIVGVLTNGTVNGNETYGSVQGLGGTVYVGGVIGIIEQGLESRISVEGNKYTAVGKTSKVGEFETQPAKYGIGTGTDEPGCIDADEKPGGNPDTQAKPAFKNANLILSGQIGVNFFLDLPEISGVDYYNGESCYMAFDIKGNKTSNNPQPTDGTLKMGDYFGYRCYINSVQMADPITADFHYGDGKTVSYVYTIQRYLDNKINGSSDENMRKLAASIKDYGHYAQLYLSRVNNWVLGVKHIALDAANEYTDSDVEAVRQIVGQYAPISDAYAGTGIASVQYSLELAAETTINLIFKMESGYTGSVFASLNGGRENMAVRQSDGTYQVQIASISAHRLADTRDCESYSGKGLHHKGICADVRVYLAEGCEYAGRQAEIRCCAVLQL